MGWPQILILFLYGASWAISLAKNGQTTRYSAMSNTISVVILMALLWWGGFFS